MRGEHGNALEEGKVISISLSLSLSFSPPVAAVVCSPEVERVTLHGSMLPKRMAKQSTTTIRQEPNCMGRPRIGLVRATRACSCCNCCNSVLRK